MLYARSGHGSFSRQARQACPISESVLDVGGVADDSAAPVRRERGRRGRAAQAGAPPGAWPCRGSSCRSSVGVGGEHLANGVRVAHAGPVVGPRMATAAAAMPFATCVALAPGAHTSAAVARMPWATCEVVAPSAGVVVDAGHGRNVVGPRSTGRGDGDGVVSMPPLKKTKRVDRRLSHWQCTFCRHETALSEQVNVCGKCNGARRQLGQATWR